MICHSDLTLTLLIDTREQDTDSLHKRIATCSLPVQRKKLDAGDYGLIYKLDSVEHVLPVVVERKMSIDELANCFGNERKRFEREFERAKTAGTKLYLLVENASWKKIYAHNYRSKMTPQALVQSILAWSCRYNMQFVFCETEVTGKLLYDIFIREYKEELKGVTNDC